MSNFACEVTGAIVLAITAAVSDYLHHGLLYMANPEGHSPKWWQKHPEAKANSRVQVKAEESNQDKTRVTSGQGQPYRDFWEVAVVIVGITGTFVGTLLLPWWFYYICITVVYLGFFFLAWDGFRKKWHPVIVSWLAVVVGILGAGWWTVGIVLAKADVVEDSFYSSLEDVRINLTNTSDYDFHNLSLLVYVPENVLIMDISQLEPVCQGFQSFIGYHPLGTFFNTPTGTKGGATGLSMAGTRRVRCDTLPRRSTVTFVVAIMSAPNPLLPSQPNGPIRPKFSNVRGEYIAVGKTRYFNFRNEY